VLGRLGLLAGLLGRARRTSHRLLGQLARCLKVNVWRSQAEHLADSLTKDDRIMVTGRLRQRT
jgi:Single-strand binding protein family